ncbi:helix-turn-helix domain-containing protein [Streptomyces bohaiensis]|uniref:helix-turn-helix domain-containing protein n=1 Tax=Streptomyces bohaiensis TaxID=1431344 RepID=UPI003B7D004F
MKPATPAGPPFRAEAAHHQGVWRNLSATPRPSATDSPPLNWGVAVWRMLRIPGGRTRAARRHRGGNAVSSAVKPTDRALFTVQETAEILSCGRSTVYELMAAGALPFVKLGRSRRVRRSDIDSFVQALQPQYA